MHKLGCMCAAGCRNRSNAAQTIVGEMRSEARAIDNGPDKVRRWRYVDSLRDEAGEIFRTIVGPIVTQGKDD